MGTSTENYGSRTEGQPSVGAVYLGSVELSRAERWVEDGQHVIRSAEFDCIAEGADVDQVVVAFVDNAFDLMCMLIEAQGAGEATDGERETLELLQSRFARAAWGERQKAARRRKVISQMRRRGEPHWGRRSPAANSLAR